MEGKLEIRLPEGMKIREGAKLKGKWEIEVFDNKENMNLISKSECHNIITNEGLDHILDVVLHGATPVSPWYCSIFESDSTPAAGWTYDTYADTDCTEWTTYDEATRPEYEEAASSSQSVSNSANKAEFTANATKTLYGAALVSVNTKSDHGAGTLLCAGVFTASQPVIDTNVVNLTYTVTAADDGE